MSVMQLQLRRNPTAWIATFGASETRLRALGMILVVAMLPTAFAYATDARLFNGIAVWDKPLKFEIALAVYVLTLAFFADFLPAGLTERRWYRIYIGAVIAAISAEMIWVAGAAILGVPSHFNTTVTGNIIYGFMGVSAVLLTSASAVYAMQIARNRVTGLPPVVKESIVIGLGLVLPLTLVTAGTMASMSSHWIGGAHSDAGGLPLMGWARDGGDLRVAHFFATHAMHVVALAGLLSAIVWGPESKGPMRLAALVYTVFVAAVFTQALYGRPFLAFL